jgi:hypothetical protein
MSGAAHQATSTLTRLGETTVVDVVIVRQGKNLKGRILAAVLGSVRKRILRTAFNESVKAIQARSEIGAAERS